MERIRGQVFPILFTDPVDEPVGIEARTGNQGFHFSVVGVQGHYRAAPCSDGFQLPVHGFFRDPLELGIDGEHQSLSRFGVHFVHDLDHTAGHIHFLPVASVFSPEVGIIVIFQAEFPDDISCLQFAVRPLGNFIVADFSHIAQGMDGQPLVGIVPDRLDFQHHSREIAEILFYFVHHIRRSIPDQTDGF